MTIEEKIFSRKRFEMDRLLKYGFQWDETHYRIERELMEGDFRVLLDIDGEGKLTGRVLDQMDQEEYAQLRNPHFQGAYVNQVRTAYEELLRDVAEACCSDLAFHSEQSNRIADLVLQRFGIQPDFPFDQKRYKPYGAFRHTDSGKWFGLVMRIPMNLLDPSATSDMVDVMNLKIAEENGEILFQREGIYPGYHMNHRTWASVRMDETLTDEMIMDLVEESFRLTDKKPGKMKEETIQKILQIADSVPYGRVASYGQIAALAGMPKNARMVGKIMSMADRYGEHPCHRVVNAAGKTVNGWKEQPELLAAEGVGFKRNGCVDMKEYQWKTD